MRKTRTTHCKGLINEEYYFLTDEQQKEVQECGKVLVKKKGGAHMLKHEQANRRRNSKVRHNCKNLWELQEQEDRRECTRVRKVNQYQVKQVKLEQSKREGTTFEFKASKKKDQPVRLWSNNNKDCVKTMDKLCVL